MAVNLNDSADIFANSSTETVTENPDVSLIINENRLKRPMKRGRESLEINFPLYSSPLAASSPCLAESSRNSMTDSFITNQFISEACNAPICLYCPFCPEEFNLEFLLKDHIKLNHPNELKNIIRTRHEAVEFSSCPYCYAKYYVKELLPKHIVKKHQECIVSMFSDVNPDKYAYCPFCTHKVLLRHLKLMSVHIEKKHYEQFQLAIDTKFSTTTVESSQLKVFDYRVVSPCTSLSNQMMRLTTRDSSQKPKRVKSILKKTTSYSEGLNESVENEKELSTFSLNNSSYMLRKSARRRLRFNLPESPPSDSDNKENLIFHPNKKRNFTENKEEKTSTWRNIFQRIKKASKKKEDKKKVDMKVIYNTIEKNKNGHTNKHDMQTTPVYSNIGFKGDKSHGVVTQFKCGLCLEGFSKNALLLDHLRRCHKGLKLVPQYRCGECDAKFFRNTFLVRHCWYHHTPKCLKKGTTVC